MRKAVSALASWWRRHPVLGAAAIYLLLSIVFVGQGLLPGRTLSGSDAIGGAVPWASLPNNPGLGTNFELADQATQFVPMLQFERRAFPHVTLWNPHLMGGRPFVGNAQSAVFSPFSLPSFILPFFDSLAIVSILKLFVAAFGMFLLGRLLGMRWGGALLSGVVFAFGTFFIVWLAWPLASIFCFIPWLFLFTELIIRRPGPLPVAALAVVVGLQFVGGHPESNFHMMFATVVWFAFRVLLAWRKQDTRTVRELVAPTLWFLGACVLGTFLAAIALAPFIELLLRSGDLTRRLENGQSTAWPAKYLGALFLHDYWGRPTQTDIEPFTANRGWYAGGITLMLATAALLLRVTATRVALVVFGLFSTCMILGVFPVADAMEQLPGFSTAHNERLLIFVLFGLALLAGCGLDELTARELPARTRRRLVVAAAGVLAVTPIVWMIVAGTLSFGEFGDALSVAWGFTHPPKLVFPPTDANAVVQEIVQMSSLLIWLPLAAAGFALIAWRLWERHRLAAGAFIALTLLLLCADLFRANMGFNPAIPIARASQPVTPAIAYLQGKRPNRFAGLGTETFTQPMPADSAMNYGLYDARGYDYPVEKRFDRLWRRNVAPTVGDFTQPVAFAERTPKAIHALSLLSVSDLMVGPKEAPLRVPGVRPAYRGTDAVIYANDRALPRVQLLRTQRTVAGEDAAFNAVTNPAFDGRTVVITEKPIPGIPQATRATTPAAASGGTARLVHYGNERLTIAANATAPSVLVLSDVSYPGWKAAVDGKDVPLERVDYLLRGVKLEPGRHVVTMRYEPTSWRIGWILSLVSLLTILGLLAWGLVARHRTPAAERRIPEGIPI